MPASSRRIKNRSAQGGAVERKRRPNPAGPPIAGREASGAASLNLQRALTGRGRASAADLMSAQRSLGNRALQKILSEARVAEHTPAAAERHEAATQRLSQEKQEESLLRRAVSGESRGGAQDPAVLSAIEAERGGGRPLDSRVAKQVGRKLGADFSSVRVHVGPRADVLNRAVNSKAFTLGRDIFFSRNAYQPGHAKGQHLIAHELIHVVQQGGDKTDKVQAKFAVAPPGDQYETVADRAAPQVAPRRPAVGSETARPAFGHEAAGAAPDRAKLKPGARAGVVQRAQSLSASTSGINRKAQDLRKGDVVLSRRRLLDAKGAMKQGVQRSETGSGPSGAIVSDGASSSARIPRGRAYEMVQNLWSGRLRLMNADFAHSALAMDRRSITHTLDGKQIRRDPEEVLAGSEVYRSDDKRLAENSAETTKRWDNVATKLRKAHDKMDKALDLTKPGKSQAAVLAAYVLAGKLTPKHIFSNEFTTTTHQATAILPALKQLIDAEEQGPGKRSRDSWHKAKGSEKGVKRWLERNLSKIKLPEKPAIDHTKVRPELLPAELHHLAVKQRPKWRYEGLL